MLRLSRQIAGIVGATPESWTQSKIRDVLPVAWLCEQFSRSRVQPFVGITSDGMFSLHID